MFLGLRCFVMEATKALLRRKFAVDIANTFFFAWEELDHPEDVDAEELLFLNLLNALSAELGGCCFTGLSITPP